MKFVHSLVMASACLLPLAASAQWQWVDKGGHKVFSDQPPPADIPEKNIVRRPGSPMQRGSVTSLPATDSSAAPAASAAKPSGVDKSLEEKARKAEDAEKANKAAEAEKLAQAKAENCQRARQGKATMDSGIRVARMNAQGEREIMDDQARAQETQRLDQIIQSDCQ